MTFLIVPARGRGISIRARVLMAANKHGMCNSSQPNRGAFLMSVYAHRAFAALRPVCTDNIIVATMSGTEIRLTVIIN